MCTMAAIPRLGDFSSAAVDFTADQIYAAINEFNAFISAANAAYTANFQLYQQNASAMTGDQLHAANDALNSENDALGQLIYYNNLANNYVTGGGLSGLGDDYAGAAIGGAVAVAGVGAGVYLSSTTLAIIGLLVGAAFATAYYAWQYAHEKSAQAVAAVNAQNAATANSSIAALQQQLTAGNITAQQFADASQKILAGAQPQQPGGLNITGSDAAMIGAFALIGVLGFAWISR